MNMKRYIGILVMAIMAITLMLPQFVLAQEQVDPPPEITSEVTRDPSVTEEWSDPDGDGFPNEQDECPWAGNEGGLGVDETGCPYYDTDWDGFFDRNDECPWQGDEGGLGVDETGCPYYDADGDGFYDRDDECPWQGDEYNAGVDDIGCPVPWDESFATEDPYATEDPWNTEEPTPTEPTATEPTATEPTPTQVTPTPTEQTPTPPPPPRNECPADVVIMVDQSSSVDNGEFEQQRQFVLGILNGMPIGANGANAGVGFFSSSIFTQVNFPLTSDGATLISDVTNYARSFGFTQHGIAINLAQAELNANGRPGVQNIIIVITDGDPFDSVPVVNVSDASNAAQLAGTLLFAVGVTGEDFNPQFPVLTQGTLEDIAGDPAGQIPDQDLIFNITFDSIGNTQFVNEIIDAICPDPEPLPPVAVDDVYFTDQDTQLDVAAPGLLANDYDYDNDPLEVVDWTDPSNGQVIFNEYDGSFTYIPNPGFTGVDTFQYWNGDDVFDSEAPAMVTIYVLGGEVTQEPTEPTATEPTATEPTATEPTPVETDDPYVTEEPGTEEWSDPDYDGDGFANDEDECPWMGDEGGLGVDETGCPYYDADWDGFFDRDDECPWQGDEDGLGVDDVGCPYYDADRDGFFDRDDECPWQGDEYGAGVDDIGCPIPWDDGYATEEPFATEETDGRGGRDDDWDGFPNAQDECPYQGNEGGLGTDDVGCPYYDADWDGVYDRNDECRFRGNEYGLGIDQNGCPVEPGTTNDVPYTTEEPGATEDPVTAPQ